MGQINIRLRLEVDEDGWPQRNLRACGPSRWVTACSGSRACSSAAGTRPSESFRALTDRVALDIGSGANMAAVKKLCIDGESDGWWDYANHGRDVVRRYGRWLVLHETSVPQRASDVGAGLVCRQHDR